MAGAGTIVEKLPVCVVPKFLSDGGTFLKWDDGDASCSPYIVKVDPKGHVLYWKPADLSKDPEVLTLTTIRDVRTGQYARAPRPQGSREIIQAYSKNDQEVHSIKERTITVIYGINLVELTYINFVAGSISEAQEWGNALYSCTNNLLKLCAAPLDFLECFYTQIHVQANTEGEIPAKLLVRNFVSHKDDKKRANDNLVSIGLAGGGKRDVIKAEEFTFEKFLAFYNRLVNRHDIDAVFAELGAKKKPYLTTDQLVSFLNNRQRDPRLNEILYPYYSKERAEEIIKEHEGNSQLAGQGHITIEGLTSFLMSTDNHVLFQSKLAIHQDMNFPITHYFINSSHNTYLTGHQLTGKSSVEIYRQILLLGCRCIELDCWDGSKDDQEPVITHGRTIVTEILFKDVIEAIKESAFKTSDYPLILSFENHCSPKQQMKMANYCVTIFGDMLLDKALDDHPLEPDSPLPSPNKLKRKILIKNKKRAPKEIKRTPSGVEQLPSTSLPADVPLEEVPEEDEVEGEEAESIEEVKEPIVKTEEDDTIAEVEAQQELSDLVNYFQPVSFRSFEHAERVRKCHEMSSFTENNAFNYLKEQPVDFVNYNKFQPSRIYPKGSRVGSDNYMPQLFWNAGCQFVALNFQTLDIPMMLNLGKFEMNGRCGFLLKPEHMRRTDQTFDPFVDTIVSGIIAGSVTIRVISAQCLSERRVNTYVEVEMYGLPADTVRRKYRTKPVKENGLNPVYDSEEPFSFKVILPQLAELRIAVYEDNGRLIGHRILPVDGLSPGFRHIKLRNEAYQPLLLPTVFVDIVTKDYVPDQFQKFADALQNPKKYLSEQDKRAEQLKALCDDDEDAPDVPDAPAVTVPVKVEGGKVEGPKGPVIAKPSEPAPNDEQRRSMTLPVRAPPPAVVKQEPSEEKPPDIETLMAHKLFLKLQSKHDNEMKTLVMKHSKDRSTILKDIDPQGKQKRSSKEKKKNGKKADGTSPEMSTDEINNLNDMDTLNQQQKDTVKAQFKLFYQEQLELAKKQVDEKFTELKTVLELMKAKRKKKLEDQYEKKVIDVKKGGEKEHREKLKRLMKEIPDKAEFKKEKKKEDKKYIDDVVRIRTGMKAEQEKVEEQVLKKWDVMVVLEGKAKKELDELDSIYEAKNAELETEDILTISLVLLPKKELAKYNSLPGRSGSVS